MNFIKLYFLAIFLCGIVTAVTAQTKACVFCEIIEGKIQQRQLVFKDNSVAAFLSHGPDNPGHLLVVPVTHAVQFTDISDSTLSDMMRISKLLIQAIRKTDIRAEAFRIMMNSGKAAGQSVMHAHFHLIPRFTGEQLNTDHVISPAAELDAVAEKIRKALIN